MRKKEDLAKIIYVLMSDNQPFDISLDNDEVSSILNVKLAENKYLVATTRLDTDSVGWHCGLSDERIDRKWLDRACANDYEWLKQKNGDMEISAYEKHMISGSRPGEPNLSLENRVFYVLEHLSYYGMGKWLDANRSARDVIAIATSHRKYLQRFCKENNMDEQDI